MLQLVSVPRIVSIIGSYTETGSVSVIRFLEMGNLHWQAR